MDDRHERRSKAIRCIHGGQFPCAQCFANMRTNLVGKFEMDPTEYLDVGATARGVLLVDLLVEFGEIDEALKREVR